MGGERTGGLSDTGLAMKGDLADEIALKVGEVTVGRVLTPSSEVPARTASGAAPLFSMNMDMAGEVGLMSRG